jgi:hypothetical protein
VARNTHGMFDQCGLLFNPTFGSNYSRGIQFQNISRPTKTLSAFLVLVYVNLLWLSRCYAERKDLVTHYFMVKARCRSILETAFKAKCRSILETAFILASLLSEISDIVLVHPACDQGSIGFFPSEARINPFD